MSERDYPAETWKERAGYGLIVLLGTAMVLGWIWVFGGWA